MLGWRTPLEALMIALKVEKIGDQVVAILNVYAIVNPDKLGEETQDDPTH